MTDGDRVTETNGTLAGDDLISGARGFRIELRNWSRAWDLNPCSTFHLGRA